MPIAKWRRIYYDLQDSVYVSNQTARRDTCDCNLQQSMFSCRSDLHGLEQDTIYVRIWKVSFT